MSDFENTKPVSYELLTCKLEFEAHDEDILNLSNCVAIKNESPSTSSFEQTTDLSADKLPKNFAVREIVKDAPQTSTATPSLPMSSDDEFTEELRCDVPLVSSQNTQAKTNFSGKMICCHLCTKKFQFKRDLLRHMHSFHKAISKSCNVCGKSFPTMARLTKHSQIHFSRNLKGSFKCDVCDCSFVEKEDFVSHMLFFKHEENRIFKCDLCGGFFMNDDDLKAHMTTHKGNPKSLHCEECGEKFKKRIDLRSHMVNHIGEKNYKCDFCNLSFKSSFILSKHKESLHSKESLLVCEICRMTFSLRDKKNYNIHLKLHSQ